MGKLSLDKVTKKSADLKKSGNYNTDYDKLEKGKNVRRVLPPKGDNDVFWSEGFLHFGLGSDGKKTVTCLETYGEGKKCPICQYVEELKKSKNKEDKQLADRIRRVKRTYIAVLNRDAEEEKPLVLPVGQTIMKQIVDLICDPDYGDITDFEDGRDITITKSGSGLNTEYSVIAKPKTTIASEDFTAEELDEELPDLDALFVRKSPEELQAILDGDDENSSDEDEDEDEDDEAIDYDDLDIDDLETLCKERGIKLPPKSTKLKLITLLEKFDAMEDDDEDDEDDEDEKPVKSSKKNSKKVEEDDEDEDSDADEDEDDDDEDDIMKEMEAALKKKKK